MTTGWQHAHQIGEQIQTTNISKDGLTRCLAVIIGMLTEGPNEPENVEKACNLMLALRQLDGIKDFLAEMKRTDVEKLKTIPNFTDPCRGQTCGSCNYPIDGCC